MVPRGMEDAANLDSVVHDRGLDEHLGISIRCFKDRAC
jgi:hypothetical protein